jgi:uncharacterized protein YecT (DUF1311 family)
MKRVLTSLTLLPSLFLLTAGAQTAEDKAVVEECLKVADARRETAYAATPDVTEPTPGSEAHLDEAATQARFARESCIGIVANPCMQTEEGSSTYGMMACIGREIDVWDARLNGTYKDRLAPSEDSGLDAKAEEISREQYRKMQRAWIPWRDATCEVLYSDGIPIYGSQSRVDGAYCLMQLTAEQALRLEGGLTAEN